MRDARCSAPMYHCTLLTTSVMLMQLSADGCVKYSSVFLSVCGWRRGLRREGKRMSSREGTAEDRATTVPGFNVRTTQRRRLWLRRSGGGPRCCAFLALVSAVGSQQLSHPQINARVTRPPPPGIKQRHRRASSATPFIGLMFLGEGLSGETSCAMDEFFSLAGFAFVSFDCELFHSHLPQVPFLILSVLFSCFKHWFHSRTTPSLHSAYIQRYPIREHPTQTC